MSKCACLMGSLFFFLSWCPRQWTMAKLLSSDPTQPKGFPPQLGPPNTIWHATSRGGGGETDARYKKNRGKETERNLLFCPVKAEVLFLVSLIKVSFAILSSGWEGTWAPRWTDSPLPHAQAHAHTFPEHIIIRSSYLTHTWVLFHSSDAFTS